MSWIKQAESDQIKMGIVVEKEHTDTIKWLVEKFGGEATEDIINEAAKRIAEDHLKELPDYYTRLKKMEGEGEGTDKKAADGDGVGVPPKSPEMESALEEMSKKMFGRSRKGNACVTCGSPLVNRQDFRDEASWREFQISHMCQKCQDEVFGV